MQLVQIDVIRLQPFERTLAGADQIEARMPVLIRAQLRLIFVQRKPGPPLAMIDLCGETQLLSRGELPQCFKW